MSVTTVSVAPEFEPAATHDHPAHPSRTRALVALGLLIGLVLQAGIALLNPRDGWAEHRASLKAQRHGTITVGAPGQPVKSGIKANGEIDPNC
mgnify:CR=1 FL=1